MNKSVHVTVVGASLLLVGSLAIADDHKKETSQVFINPALGYWHLDSERNADGNVMGALGLEYRHDRRFGIELLAADANPEFDITGRKGDAHQLRLDGLYYFDKMADGSWTPYVGLGYGRTWLDSRVAKTDENQFNLGGGIHYVIDHWFSYRFDLRGLRGEDGEIDAMVTLGFSAAIGGPGRKPKAKPAADTALAAGAVAAATLLDADGDGIADDQDQCADSPAGVPVDQNGCPLDSDGDGVPDYLDKCADTRMNAKVDDQGCEVKRMRVDSFELQVLFGTNMAVVSDRYVPEVEKLATFLKDHPSLSVEIEGHTDNTGAVDYNKRLSLRRAQAVAIMLISRFGVPAERVTTVGYGLERPIASNDSADGRAQNRRVVVNLEVQVEDQP